MGILLHTIKALKLFLFVMGWNSFAQPNWEGISTDHSSIESSEFETGYFTSHHLFMGSPVVSAELCADYKILSNDGYVVGFCDSKNIALWSAYRLFKVSTITSPPKRPPYKSDDRVNLKLDPKFYSKTGYDAGHLAPNAGIFNRYGRNAQIETFLLSNFGPQTTRLNRGPWKSVEYRVSRWWSQAHKELWIITGPVLKSGLPVLKESVPIPEEYYKIIVDVEDDKPRAMAFIMPNTDTMNSMMDQFFSDDIPEDSELPAYRNSNNAGLELLMTLEMNSFLVSIDDVEAKTGLDFYTELEDSQEKLLEELQSEEVWKKPNSVESDGSSPKMNESLKNP